MAFLLFARTHPVVEIVISSVLFVRFNLRQKWPLSVVTSCAINVPFEALKHNKNAHFASVRPRRATFAESIDLPNFVISPNYSNSSN